MRAPRLSAISRADLHPSGPARLRWRLALILAIGLLLAAAPARSELRFSNRPEVFLNDFDLTLQAVLLGAIPPSFHESLKSGIPTHIRFYIELWKYNGRFWPNERLHARTVERQLTYNVVTKEYKVVSTAGEQQEPYVTKDLREAQRVASEIRGLKLGPASALDPSGLYFVQVKADVSLSGVNSFLARLTGDADQTDWIRSDLLTPLRSQ
ncbi:MAG: DUF4390 domain-containing protein [Candidatus Rokubacteria bacterium]|nr:DUF4390 domain-containing protein [Candidatus Rokubacteria bacterium]